MLGLFDIAAMLLVLSALFGWINVRFLRLPHAIGLLVMALGASLGVIAVDYLLPSSDIRTEVVETIEQIDFFDTLMGGMLAFLLFAGALHVDFARLRSERWPVGIMATIGVLMSTLLVGTGFFLAANALGFPLPFAWALVFGALISPTDPVAVLSLLKTSPLPQRMEMKIAGESLFNDGVGVVAFTVLVSMALQGEAVSLLHGAEVFLWEALGGVVLGLAAGSVAVAAMRAIDDSPTEILLTLGLVTGLYAVALKLHMSGPLGVVAAGLLVGNRGRAVAMSETTRQRLFDFWQVIDEILNAVLFLLIGLEVLVIADDRSVVMLVLIAIPIVLAARLLSLASLLAVPPLRRAFGRGSLPVLTWGGLRGGISVALALSLPHLPVREPILVATYGVVIFSVIVQGLSLPSLIRRLRFE